MPVNLKGRSLLSLKDFSRAEIRQLIESSIEFERLKRARVFPRNLVNRNIAVIFLKPSCRTRSAVAVAAADEGGNVQVLPHEEIRFGIKESVRDVARVLGRMFDGIAFRGFEHQVIAELAEHAGVPVWNCLCDLYHPTQVLADLMTIQEELGHLSGVRIAYVGDGRNNMARSLAIGSIKMGIDLRVVAPPPLQPDMDALAETYRPAPGETGRVRVTADLAEGLRDSDVVYGDVWVSMGEEALIEERIAVLRDYQVTPQVMDLTKNPATIYLHCLPSLHDMNTEFARQHPDVMEVADEVFEGPQSRVFDQAENRMHTLKSLMVATI
jgi:ornithine carbamoyltransferase